jgi:hypothetical protein
MGSAQKSEQSLFSAQPFDFTSTARHALPVSVFTQICPVVQSLESLHFDTQKPRAQTKSWLGAICLQSLFSKQVGVGFAGDDPPQP